MDKQPDRDLSNHIQRVFDEFEVPQGAADAGWAALRKRYPARKHRPAAWWWSSAAAILLLIGLCIWLSEPMRPYQDQQTGKTPVTRKVMPPNTLITYSRIDKIQRSAGSLLTIVHPANPVPAQGGKPVLLYKKTQPSLPTDTGRVVTANPSLSTNSSIPAILPADSSIQHKNLFNASPVLTDVQSSNITKEQPLYQGMERVFAREAATAATGTANPSIKTATSAHKRMVLSIYAGTHFNYASGSSNQLNAGAGLNSDIRLVKKISLVTGIAIAQNRLHYANEPAQGNIYASAIAAATGQQGLSDLAVSAFFSGFAPRAASTTQLKGYNASFTGLDIPLNIKYEFDPGKSDSYIVAGVSSGTFINETYRYDYSTNLLPSENHTAETQARFSTFDFARTLNVALGIGTPVGKSNRLIIEPFLKYPLSGLGSQQIKFGATGINLKFRFSSGRQAAFQ
ncbi:hypothetical protein [Mucilaginibacter sp.]